MLGFDVSYYSEVMMTIFILLNLNIFLLQNEILFGVPGVKKFNGKNVSFIHV